MQFFSPVAIAELTANAGATGMSDLFENSLCLVDTISSKHLSCPVNLILGLEYYTYVYKSLKQNILGIYILYAVIYFIVFLSNMYHIFFSY